MIFKGQTRSDQHPASIFLNHGSSKVMLTRETSSNLICSGVNRNFMSTVKIAGRRCCPKSFCWLRARHAGTVDTTMPCLPGKSIRCWLSLSPVRSASVAGCQSLFKPELQYTFQSPEGCQRKYDRETRTILKLC